MRRECDCPTPHPHPNPRLPDDCVSCGFWINPEADWVSSDKTVAEFFGRLAEAAFPGEAPEGFESFRRQCEARERAGRGSFGFAYASRDNLAESVEELSDFVIYLLLDGLKHRRNGGGDEDLELALTGAMHAFRAYEATRHLAARRRGSP